MRRGGRVTVSIERDEGDRLEALEVLRQRINHECTRLGTEDNLDELCGYVMIAASHLIEHEPIDVDVEYSYDVDDRGVIWDLEIDNYAELRRMGFLEHEISTMEDEACSDAQREVGRQSTARPWCR